MGLLPGSAYPRFTSFIPFSKYSAVQLPAAPSSLSPSSLAKHTWQFLSSPLPAFWIFLTAKRFVDIQAFTEIREALSLPDNPDQSSREAANEERLDESTIPGLLNKDEPPATLLRRRRYFKGAIEHLRSLGQWCASISPLPLSGRQQGSTEPPTDDDDGYPVPDPEIFAALNSLITAIEQDQPPPADIVVTNQASASQTSDTDAATRPPPNSLSSTAPFNSTAQTQITTTTTNPPIENAPGTGQRPGSSPSSPPDSLSTPRPLSPSSPPQHHVRISDQDDSSTFLMEVSLAAPTPQQQHPAGPHGFRIPPSADFPMVNWSTDQAPPADQSRLSEQSGAGETIRPGTASDAPRAQETAHAPPGTAQNMVHHRVTALSNFAGDSVASHLSIHIANLICIPLESFAMRSIALGFLTAAGTASVGERGADTRADVYPLMASGGITRPGGYVGYAGRLMLCMLMESCCGWAVWRTSVGLAEILGRRKYGWGRL